MNKEKTKQQQEIEATERIARIEDPQGNEVDDRLHDDRPFIDRARLDAINIG